MKKDNKNKKSLRVDSRRDFIKKVAVGTGAMSMVNLPVFAGPFSYDEGGHLIPEDKKLSPEWIKLLYERGEPEVFKTADGQLKYIGMPVGGVACGQLYLGGDGRLWFWHIFKTEYTREKDHGQRYQAMTLGSHYLYPDKVFERENRPVIQGAAIRITSDDRTITKTIDAGGFKDIQFRGEYPIGKVSYKDDDLPVQVNLEAFSPFIPLNAEKSALPVTIMNYKVKNTSGRDVKVELGGWLENAVCPYNKDDNLGERRSTLHVNKNRVTVHATVNPFKRENKQDNTLPDVVFEDFESGSYKNWKVEGKSFGDIPYQKKNLSLNQDLQGYEGQYFINGYNARETVANPDTLKGTLTSKKFKITHKYITFKISGGSYKNRTAVNLLIKDQVVRSETGNNRNTMITKTFDVEELIGQKAQIQIVDNIQGSWGHITADHFVFTNKKIAGEGLEKQHGYGSMAWSLYNPTDKSSSVLNLSGNSSPESVLDALSLHENSASATSGFNEVKIAALGEAFDLKAGEEKEVTFMLSWFFPHLNQQHEETGQLLALKDIKFLKRHYYNWFKSANQVADYVASDFAYLADTTRLWNKTYYDSTLPYWLLDRSFISIDCLASNTFNWFDNGRVWGWEGVECCPGTCQHVWQYAQGSARIFPQLERTLRELTDLGYSYNEETGVMGHRDETAGRHGLQEAHDGHAGTIMRMYREHKTSADNRFLKSNYTKIKKAVQFLINEDKDKDGILEGRQQNTLDAAWFGPMGWISSLYLGALAAGKAMAEEVGDIGFADECHLLIEKGRKNVVEELFNGEYFIHKPDYENHPKSINSNDGCHIDQVLGQSFAHQIGINERVVPQEQTKSALASIWKYNFAPDAYAYQEKHTTIRGPRIYATKGEAATIMCTWPKGGDDKAVPGMENRPLKSPVWTGPGGYFDEAMNGFEYQVATHMIWEGLLEKGLATAKVVHDRYDANKRNPYNEIECSDHYSRSMASYGVLLAVCGFDYHGPKGQMTFKPKMNSENFKAPFTASEGWGTISQVKNNGQAKASVLVGFGKLELQQLNLESERKVKSVLLNINKEIVTAKYKQEGKNINITFDAVCLRKSDVIQAELIF